MAETKDGGEAKAPRTAAARRTSVSTTTKKVAPTQSTASSSGEASSAKAPTTRAKAPSKAPKPSEAASSTPVSTAKAAAAAAPGNSRRVSMPSARTSVSGTAAGRSVDSPIPEAVAPYTPVLGRIPIIELRPQVEDNLWPAKAFVGEVVLFGATVFREGHDLIGVDVVITDPSGAAASYRLTEQGKGLDHWGTPVRLDSEGSWTYQVKAWSDDFGSWLHNAEIKVPAGIDVELMFAAGAELLHRGAAEAGRTESERRILTDGAVALLDTSLPAAARMRVATDAALTAVIDAKPIGSLETISPTRTVIVERTRAGRGAWYEFFPRSEGATRNDDGSWHSGTFRSAARRLAHVAAMGFDVVYIPPIHPIGTTNRKGPNNTLVAGPNDPGSPYGIGSAAGGHDAINPELGTDADFKFFIDTARRLNLEIALDIALQASPDHPWVTEHPEFFNHLPDGSIAYAENPPKKYQDIYPLNFDNDPEGSYREMLRIFMRWVDFGVRIFRVDNPHTKPVSFWERLIHEVNASHPDVIFLAEAFTRPAMMRTLAKVGFQQSYTYFTWRNTKEELADYLTELATETDDYLRPNLFVNTHDILTPYLQFGGPAAYKIRAAIAATGAPTWGVYSGYELFEDVARPGSEENIDNEKYEFKPRDYAKAQLEGRSLAPYLTRLNEIRRAHPALGQLRNLRVQKSDDTEILAFSKHLDGRFTESGQPDTIIVVANLDPHAVRETIVRLDLEALGLPVGSNFQVRDLITDSIYSWSTDNYVRLDPFWEPVHILSIVRPDSAQPDSTSPEGQA